MAFAIDACMAVKWVLDEPDGAAAVRVAREGPAAPDLLQVGCAGALRKTARRGELTVAEAAGRLALLAEAAVERLPSEVLLPGAMQLALRLGHPVHDCLYLEAARATGFPLVTTDRRLARLDVPGCAVRLPDELP